MSAAWNGGAYIRVYRSGSQKHVANIRLPEIPGTAEIVYDLVSLVEKTIELEGLEKFMKYPFVEKVSE